MTMTIRRAEDRGFFDFGWLKTYHTFSFGNYHDPEHMGFRTLRVINQDIVQPGRGFDLHAHHDMEIITYILQGAVTHTDTMGNETVIRAGEIQCMSAGSGVKHSEYNRSDAALELLQIWILPNQKNLTPAYQQQAFDPTFPGFQLLAAAPGMNGLVSINQDAKLFRVAAEPDTMLLEYFIPKGRGAWIQVISGQVFINEQLLNPGDGASVSAQDLEIVAKTSVELLLFEL